MKIKIEIEVEQEEIPLVTELVSLLRQLKATITPPRPHPSTSSTVAVALTVPPAVAAPAPTAPSVSSAPPAQPAIISSPAPATAVSTTSPVVSPVPAPAPVPVPVPVSVPVPPPAPAAPPLLPGGGEGIPRGQQYRKLIVLVGESEDEAADAALATQVVAELRRLMEQSPGGTDEAVEEFFAEFSEVVFSIDRVQRNQSILPFVSLLPRLGEPFKTKVRDKLIQRVLKHLTAKRPIDCNRMDFFAFAEAFAALVKVEFVNIAGAITTITTLLGKPDTRCAAVTMLGKTVELCLHLLNDKCDASKLGELRAALGAVQEEVFRYDVNYIEENMGWTAPLPLSSLNAASEPVAQPATPTATAPQASPAPPPAATAATLASAPGAQLKRQTSGGSLIASPIPVPATAATVQAVAAATAPAGMPPTGTPVGRLIGKGRFTGHADKIFTICYDSARESLVTSGRDGLVISWEPDGKLRDRAAIPGQYACSMDINPRTRSLFLCGVPKDSASAMPPSLMLYTLGSEDSASWKFAGALGKPPGAVSRIVSCVEAMVQDQGNHFATGESLNSELAGYVRIYDADADAFEALQPIASFREHEDFITSLANHPSAEGMLFSGSRDGTIRLWDQRQQKSAAVVGLGQQGPRRASQDGMITCIHASGCLLASGALDSRMRIWDLRNLSAPSFNLSVDESPILKVSLSPQSTSSYPIVAVSTNSKTGLFLSFPAAGQTIPAPEPPTACFYDLVWGDRDDTGNPVLYAAGDDLRKYGIQWD